MHNKLLLNIIYWLIGCNIAISGFLTNPKLLGLSRAQSKEQLCSRAPQQCDLTPWSSELSVVMCTPCSLWHILRWLCIANSIILVKSCPICSRNLYSIGNAALGILLSFGGDQVFDYVALSNHLTRDAFVELRTVTDQIIRLSCPAIIH